MNTLLGRMRRQWFLLLLAAAVGLGVLTPKMGMWIHGNVGIKPAILALMFLISATLPLGDMWSSIRHGRGLLTAIGGGYLILPLFLFGVTRLPLPEDMRIGLILVAAAPTTLASAAIWARLAGGNDGLSLAATILSNGFCFLAAPAIIYLLARQTIEIPGDQMRKMALDLFIVIVIPVTAGQLVRWKLSAQADQAKTFVSVICRLLVLSVVLTSTSMAANTAAGVQGGASISGGVLALILFITSAVHLAAAGACWALAGTLGCTRGDQIAAMLSGSQKTLPVGLFLAEFFPQYAFAILPVLCYHAMQLILDTVLVEFLNKDPA